MLPWQAYRIAKTGPSTVVTASMRIVNASTITAAALRLAFEVPSGCSPLALSCSKTVTAGSEDAAILGWLSL